MVAQAACGGDIAKAQKLPSPLYARYLHFASAENESQPQLLERQKERQERAAQEEKERREAIDDF